MKTILGKFVIGVLLSSAVSPVAWAHCDTLGGPVVLAAREALTKGDVTPVLKWVKPADEAAIREAFAKTSTVRKQSTEAAALADTWFFETLVRVHRAGEGAPYTGLKADEPVEPGIAAADHALASGKIEDVASNTITPLQAALKAKYDRVRAQQAHANQSVEAGRAYVEAYVDYIHFAERVAALAATPTSAHGLHEH